MENQYSMFNKKIISLVVQYLSALSGFQAILTGQDISATSKWIGVGVASGSTCNLVQIVKVLDIILYC
jgi:glutamine synthetase type III